MCIYVDQLYETPPMPLAGECKPPGPCLNIKTVFPGSGIPMLKIRRSQDRLIFNIGIPILVIQHLYIEAPRIL